jgi:hypothetical protein
MDNKVTPEQIRQLSKQLDKKTLEDKLEDKNDTGIIKKIWEYEEGD